MIVVRKLFTRPSDMKPRHTEDSDHTYVAEFQAVNPGINGMTIRDIHNMLNLKFVISRVWHEGKVSIPGPDRRIMEGDRLLVVTNEEDIPRLMMLFGKKTDKDWNRPDINWNRIDKNLVSKTVVVSKPGLNGKRLGSLHLRNNYEINISRVMRSGVRLLADPQLVLQLGDRVTIVGLAADVDKVAALLGNSVNELRDPNLASVFIGMVLGLVLGSIPILIPGMSTPVKLGLAGGPIVVGILIGRFGPSFHLITYTTQSANLMLRGIGLSLYLACLGLEAGESFLDTILRADGLVWIAAGFVITLIPSIIMLLGAMRWGRLDYGTASGMVCGAMANPMALTYANDSVKGDEAAVAYASVYPLSMFTRVVIAQLLVLLLL